ncbi:hypothetical protein CDL15_Pgr023577 [Punica granatum]|uniref:Uncharacterized protein n=1 Tax=Punica granatum TaxID=22663 RepID=A0A218W960_PUNGR|nr:hypothetical protein CDL15_Pgr023577 [Punica granatum]
MWELWRTLIPHPSWYVGTSSRTRVLHRKTRASPTNYNRPATELASGRAMSNRPSGEAGLRQISTFGVVSALHIQRTPPFTRLMESGAHLCGRVTRNPHSPPRQDASWSQGLVQPTVPLHYGNIHNQQHPW